MGNFSVGVYDAHGNFCSTANNSIGIQLNNPNTGGLLSGTTTVAAVNGSATFTNLLFSYTGATPAAQPLVATSLGLTSATSPDFSSTTCVVTTAAANGSPLTGIHAGDWNGDGRPDIMVDSRGNKSLTFYYFNGASGVFSQSGGNTLTQNYHNVVVGDFNGDGYADYAVNDASVNSNTTSGTVYTNNHAGFTASAVGLGANANCIVTMDVDGDGKLDLLGGSTTGLVSWAFGNGSGSFSAWSSSNAVVGNPPAMWPAVGKFTGRTGYDFAYMTYASGNWSVYTGYNGNGTASINLNQNDIGGWGALNGNSVYFGTSNGGIQLGFKYTPANNGESFGNAGNTSNGAHLYFADISGDGSADLVTTTDTGCVYSVSSAPTISFGGQTAFTTNHRAVWATAGDFNADGTVDIALANSDALSFSVIFRP